MRRLFSQEDISETHLDSSIYRSRDIAQLYPGWNTRSSNSGADPADAGYQQRSQPDRQTTNRRIEHHAIGNSG